MTSPAANLAFESQTAGSWNARPFQLVNLWNMLRFEAHWFNHAVTSLDHFLCECKAAISERGADSQLPEQDTELLRSVLSFIRGQAERLALKRTPESVSDIEMDIDYHAHVKSFVPAGKLRQAVAELRRDMSRDLQEHVFMCLTDDDVKYYEQEQLFGPEVFANFPSTRHDVTEAGCCYATGRYTACVFHCMRVVEKGLHALVGELNSKHNAGIVFRDKVEHENWGAIITEIQLALENPKRIKRLDPLPTKDEMTFYSKVAMESEYIKNAWRDDVAHSRSEYDQPGALSVMDHVGAFMKHLARQGLTE